MLKYLKWVVFLGVISQSAQAKTYTLQVLETNLKRLGWQIDSPGRIEKGSSRLAPSLSFINVRVCPKRPPDPDTFRNGKGCGVEVSVSIFDTESDLRNFKISASKFKEMLSSNVNLSKSITPYFLFKDNLAFTLLEDTKRKIVSLKQVETLLGQL